VGDKMNVRELVRQAMLAAIYFVLTVPFEPISFGPVQFRISEILVILVLINPKHLIGIVLGTFIANLYSPEMPFDFIIGTGATLLALLMMIKTSRNEKLALIWPAVFNGLIIAWELWKFLGIPFVPSVISIFISQIVIVYIPGLLFLPKIRKNKHLMRVLS